MCYTNADLAQWEGRMTTALVEAARLVVLAMDGHLPLDEALADLRRELEAHETRDGYASACWSVDDIHELRPLMTEEQARDFLASHEGPIQDAMVSAGWEAIEVLLDDEDARPLSA